MPSLDKLFTLLDILLLTRHIHTVSIVSNINFLGADRHDSRGVTPCELGFILEQTNKQPNKNNGLILIT